MARPECFVSRWKVQRKVWTPENTRGPPLRDQRRRSWFSGFTRPSRLRGAPRMGRPKAFDCAAKIRLAQARPPTNLMSALARFEGKRCPRSAPSQRPEATRAGNLQRRILPGKLTEPVHTLHALEAEGQRGANKKVPSLRRHQVSNSLRPKGGALLQESGGWQMLALRRQPPCGGRRYGCRASWPCRQDCR